MEKIKRKRRYELDKANKLKRVNKRKQKQKKKKIKNKNDVILK